MKSFLVVLGVSVLGILTARAVQVNGYVYLSDNWNSYGIKVAFRALSPSAQSDSAYADTSGYFDLTLQPGVYDVEYSHPTYATYRVPSQVLLWDTTLDEAILMPPLFGDLSGVLGPGDFQVTDSIIVNSGQSLTIQPGTRLFFDGMHPFMVYGLLTAIGTEQDSIVLTHRNSSGADTLWNGIVFLDANDECRLDHVRLEYANRDLASPYWAEGAALYCVATDMRVSDCAFRHNGRLAWSIVSLGQGNASLEDCLFEDNSADVIIDGNDSLVIERCTFQHNSGIAIYMTGGTISRSLFRDNNCNGWQLELRGSIVVEYCIIEQRLPWSSDAMRIEDADMVTISNSTLYGQRTGYGRDLIVLSGPHIVLNSCNVTYLTSPWNSAVFFVNGSEDQVRYCDFFVPVGSNFGYYGEDPANAPAALGLIALTNANGDSCDTYYNIFLDPQFADTASGDYHLLGGSPCIDAGDPELPSDPDGTVADIGAFYFDQTSVPDPEHSTAQSFALMQNYPNPFNSSTRIEFDLPRASEAHVRVFDVTGRALKTLAAGPMTAGHHEILFDAAGLPSGMYFYQLDADAVRQTRKMVLIK